MQEKLNQAIHSLFKEAQFPEDPTEYVASQLCASKLHKAEESIKKVERLEREIRKLKQELRGTKK